MSELVALNYNDLDNIGVQFEMVIAILEQADIFIDRLFLNVDAGFDLKNFRVFCNKKEI